MSNPYPHPQGSDRDQYTDIMVRVHDLEVSAGRVDERLKRVEKDSADNDSEIQRVLAIIDDFRPIKTQVANIISEIGVVRNTQGDNIRVIEEKLKEMKTSGQTDRQFFVGVLFSVVSAITALTTLAYLIAQHYK